MPNPDFRFPGSPAMTFDEFLRNETAAEQEILSTVRLQYGEQVADALRIIAAQARSLTALLGVAATTMSPLLESSTREVAVRSMHGKVVDVIAWSTTLAIAPYIEDEIKRREVIAFATTLARRAMDSAAVMVTKYGPLSSDAGADDA